MNVDNKDWMKKIKKKLYDNEKKKERMNVNNEERKNETKSRN